MTLFLTLAACLSLAVILLGYWADRAAIAARINGANGLPVLVALIASFLLSLGTATVAGIWGGWSMLGAVLATTVAAHVTLGGVLIWRLQRLATRAARADRKGLPR